ncbi:unnamed protein product [Adineta ricciae]|uniref:PIN domain-containing protein n=1 Tax=Adineta ricciae TaxID=249248 RepID=A0A813RYH1_ADIRI|nr:unnamed protein product [Adineta ricciae]
MMVVPQSQAVSTESKMELDKNKQNYIQILTLSKRLSDRYSANQSLQKIFNPEPCRLRDKFKHMCETLLLDDPIDYGLKIIDLLWRKAAYEPIQVFKRHRQDSDESVVKESEIMYRMHLLAIFGFYSNLLMKFAALIKPYRNLSHFFDFIQLFNDNKSVNMITTMKTDNLIESLLKLIHKCLICLGDISRYLSEYDGCTQTAEKYYTMAVLLDHEVGMPLNQLGTLCGRSNSNCDAAFFYLLCLSTAHPFEGAKDNLQMLFERNEKRFQELSKQHGRNRNENLTNRDIRRFLVEFLHVTHQLLESNNIGQIQDCGQQTLNDFNACMFSQNDSILSPELIFKLLSISMILVDRIQRTRSRTVKQPILFAGIAFAIALFSHVVNHTIIRLQNAFYQLHDVRTKTNETDSEEEEERRQAEAKEKRRRMKMVLSRRRRRSASSSSNGSDQSDGSLSNERDPRRDDSSDDYHSEDEIPDYLSGGSSSDENDEIKQVIRDEKDKEAEELAIKVALEEFMEKIKQSGAVFQNANDSQIPQTSLFSFTDLSTHLFAAFALQDGASPLFLDQNAFDEDPYSMSMYSYDQPYKSILVGNKQINVPPGFEQNRDALAAAEIEQKMAEFPLEHIVDNATNDDDDEDEDEDEDNNDHATRYHGTKLIIELLENEYLLSAIKIFCDWLAGNKRLLQMLLPISQGLWSKLALLLNFLPHERDIIRSGLVSVNSSIHPLLSKFVETKVFVFPPPMLDEDIQLRAFQALKVDRNHLKLNLNQLSSLSKFESTIIRICSLRRFGYYVSSLLSNSQFSYDNNKLSFVAAMVPSEQAPVEASASKTADPIADEERKSRLMRDMAALRLQAEISQLENSLKNEEFSLPPYLVIDSSVLCTNLNLIQQFVQSQRFIIVIPLVVIDILDELKKEQREARDAIRWLETQFRLGNRFIRTQAAHERLNNPSKKKTHKNKDFCRFQEILDCCLYFSQQSNRDKQSSAPPTANSSLSTANVLTARTLTNKEQQTVDKEGVTIQHIDDFHRRWKQSTPEK